MLDAGPDGWATIAPSFERYLAMERDLPRYGAKALDGRVDRVRQIGDMAGIGGNKLYNPFGGVDVFHQFGLSDTIEEVISHGCEPFGTAESVAAAFEYHAGERRRLHEGVFDKSDELAGEAKRWGGIGHLALERLDKMGTLLEVHADGAHGTAVFRAAGRQRRFTYIRQQVGADGSTVGPLPGILDAFAPETVLIKAAETWFDGAIHPAGIFALALEPARRHDARVVADGNVPFYNDYCSREPRPIWRLGTNVCEIVVPWLQGADAHDRFGYDVVVESGRGRDLLLWEDPRVQEALRNRAGSGL